ncbi:winged helix-turn-helix transcriptional regulator [Streptomyces sp. 11x1]|uniref:winged helix-turn-helix transcriptional regulator n=1 Tax=Streptomyces sp. 11x1 TaxID=3038642 RepID=UPI0037D9E6B8
MEVTVNARQSPADTEVCDVREALDLVADKWSLYVVSNLNDGPRRFNELKRAVQGVSQRMLTVTLRRLERDGILTRTVHEVMPPHVTYRLTPLGTSLLHAAAPLIAWSSDHLAEIASARAEHDRSQGLESPTVGARS